MYIKALYKAVVIGLLLAVPIVLLAQGLGQNGDDTFDPATYGIPDEIAGYQVLAVRTKENTVCFGGGDDNVVKVVLRAPQTDMAGGIPNNNIDEVMQVLNQIDPNKDWQFSLLSPDFTANYVINRIKDINRTNSRLGCVTLGGFIIPTPQITSNLPSIEE